MERPIVRSLSRARRGLHKTKASVCTRGMLSGTVIALSQIVLTEAARGLIWGEADPLTEDEATDDGGRIAALLCFDEMQITDVFTAVALKGAVGVRGALIWGR